MSKRNNKETEEIIDIIDDDEIEETLEDKDYENIPMDDRIYNIERKIKIIYILVILTTILSFLTLVTNFALNSSNKNTTTTNNQNNETEEMYTYDTKDFKEITAKDIKSESKNETIVVLVGRQGCYYCAEFAPTITAVAKEYNVTIRYIDFAKIVDFKTTPTKPAVSDSESYNLIKNLEGKGSWSGFGEKAMRGTPNTLIIKNNIIISGVNGNSPTDTVRAAFEEAGLKK